MRNAGAFVSSENFVFKIIDLSFWSLVRKTKISQQHIHLHAGVLRRKTTAARCSPLNHPRPPLWPGITSSVFPFDPRSSVYTPTCTVNFASALLDSSSPMFPKWLSFIIHVKVWHFSCLPSFPSLPPFVPATTEINARIVALIYDFLLS